MVKAWLYRDMTSGFWASGGLGAAPELLQPVIWRFLGDDDVVDVAFFEASGGDSDEF